MRNLLKSWLPIPVWLLVLPRLAAAVTNVVYSTAFEPAEGYDPAYELIGQAGWVGAGTGGNGLVTNFFAGHGQQAYIGYWPPEGTDDILSVWRPVNFDPVAAGTPVVRFSVLMEVVDSANGEYDNFYWSVYNASNQRLFTLDFDNYSTEISYVLDGTNGFVGTGKYFTNNTAYTLVLTMDFARNVWSAALDGRQLVTNLPITTVGADRTLGDIDAVWAVYTPGRPGDNYLLFDNYRIVATGQSARLAPPLRLPNGQVLLHLTAPAGSRHAIEATTNFTHWVSLKTNVASDGSFDYLDTGAAGLVRRFYRARLVP